MRDIKFKFWDKEDKKFVERPENVIMQGDGKIFGDWREFEDYIESTLLIPCQYTGLKDKKGEEIYEGHVLDYYYIVEWDEAAATYILTDIEEKVYCMDLSEKAGVEEHGITGNVYENSKLLIKENQNETKRRRG